MDFMIGTVILFLRSILTCVDAHRNIIKMSRKYRNSGYFDFINPGGSYEQTQ